MYVGVCVGVYECVLVWLGVDVRYVRYVSICCVCVECGFSVGWMCDYWCECVSWYGCMLVWMRVCWICKWVLM